MNTLGLIDLKAKDGVAMGSPFGALLCSLEEKLERDIKQATQPI